MLELLLRRDGSIIGTDGGKRQHVKTRLALVLTVRPQFSLLWCFWERSALTCIILSQF